MTGIAWALVATAWAQDEDDADRELVEARPDDVVRRPAPEPQGVLCVDGPEVLPEPELLQRDDDTLELRLPSAADIATWRVEVDLFAAERHVRWSLEGAPERALVVDVAARRIGREPAQIVLTLVGLGHDGGWRGARRLEPVWLDAREAATPIEPPRALLVPAPRAP